MTKPSPMRRLATALLALLVVAVSRPDAQRAALPNRPDSLKFAVIGDTGTGDRPEFDVGQQMQTARTGFPFELVIMLGDNIYGRQQPQDFVDKFERPYAPLLQAGVPFYATLGNHDDQANRFYKGFNMGGERYYTFARKNTRFVVLDSNQLDPKQRAWADQTLQQAEEPWKICYFHHPIYSDGGRHGSDVSLRVAIEPLFTKYGVNVVFAGHDHVYERLIPQKGIAYFVAGSAGELRRGDVRPSRTTAAFYDQDQAFMLVEVDQEEMFFEAVSRTGKVVDSGVIERKPKT
jgi:calcineurin-like phosphoesterase family protein